MTPTPPDCDTLAVLRLPAADRLEHLQHPAGVAHGLQSSYHDLAAGLNALDYIAAYLSGPTARKDVNTARRALVATLKRLPDFSALARHDEVLAETLVRHGVLQDAVASA